MADYIKYFTSPMFKRDEFVNMLKSKMNVRAYAVDDGIILDKEAFNAVRVADMTHWAYINRKCINSNLHTRSAEWYEIPKENEMLYILIIYVDDNRMEVEKSDSLDYLKGQADAYTKLLELTCTKVVDNTTGEVMYET